MCRGQHLLDVDVVAGQLGAEAGLGEGVAAARRLPHEGGLGVRRAAPRLQLQVAMPQRRALP